ncbi:MAG: chromosome segregation protein SMC [Halobacteria archaeon]|nr:chromosome segregation protein SMC [Halobacteria archaeon]
MHIKEIRVDGFKSFGRPTTVPFYEGFTTISGPNGSGKSNLIDSILFALGLARTRGMRAERLPDLLYDPPEGDSAREASVEVVLDNSERTLQPDEIRTAAGEVGDPDEVVIKRRIKRTENDYYSYYYINGRSCNLSDIQELLANAGITPEGYNVVMQGDVTEIIQMSSTERRRIVEEAAGTAEFDEKKDEARGELDTVDERVERVDLILDEIEERLDSLKDERDKALEYRELREEKQEKEGLLSVARLRQLEDEIEELEDEIADEKEMKEELDDDLEEAESLVDELRDEVEEVEDEIRQKGEDERLKLKSEIEEIKGKISGKRDRIENAEESLDEYEKEKRQAFVEIDKAKEEIEDLESEIRETKVEKSSLKSDLASKESDLEDVEERIDEAEGEYADVRDSLEEHKHEVERLRDEKNDLMREKDRLLDDARRRSREEEDLEDEITQTRNEIQEVEDEIDEISDSLENERHNLEELRGVKQDLRSERDELRRDLDDIEESLRSKQEEFAQEQARQGSNGSSYSKAVSTVLNSDIDGVHGTIADLGSVSQKYATAVETAAGGRMAHVVVDDDGVGQKAIEYLKRRNAGRATFLPISEMNTRSLSSRPLSKDGVVDYAYSLVEFDEVYSSVFSYVLGDTLVVEEMETAREMMGSYRMVTLDGDLVEKSGAMTGGSKKGSRYSFGSKGTLEKLADRIEELESERASLKDEISSVEERIEDVDSRISSSESSVERYERRLEDLEERRGDLEDSLEDARERLDGLEDTKSEKRERMEEIDSRIDGFDDEIQSHESRIEELQEELADSEISDLSERADQLRDEIAEIEDRLRDVDADLNELELEKGYRTDRIDELEEKIESLDESRDEKESLIRDLRDEIDELEDERHEKESRIQEIEDEIGELRQTLESLEDDLDEAVEERDGIRRKINEVDERIETLRTEKSSLEDEADELEDEVDLEGYEDDDIPSYSEIRSSIDEIESQMEDLEPVNMLAIDEYDEVRERKDDLTTRKETLEDERDEILDRIDTYDELKHDKFREAFDEINSEFEEVFRRLSDGTGELVLEEPDEPFEGGMTIEAKPSDKPVKRLESMSGGERSLTALSFIFAVQRYTPAPFYAFDEVDMFLDAPNADRVAEMIDDISDDTQFIVVSLRTQMVEKAERTVGVTMEGDNVSRVTGVRLNDDSQNEEETAPEAD